MGKINGCLKCLFVFFNVLYAIIGCVLIYLVVKAQTYNNEMSAVGGPNMAWGWVFAVGVLAISCLGIYAACSENGIALKVFAGFMVVGMILMLIFGIVVVVARNKAAEMYENATFELAKPFIEDEGTREILKGLQQSIQCCGVLSAKDWGDEIPESCSCKSGNGYECKPRPQGTTGPDMIYRQSCGHVLYGWGKIFFNVVMGFFFGLAVTALLGLLVTVLMIHQVKRHDSTGAGSIPMKGY